jgi:ADP-ribose pyrophosphatase
VLRAAALSFRREARYAEPMAGRIYQGRIIDLRVEQVTLPNGVTIELELIDHRGAAAVAAVDDAGQVVLIRQYRHAAGGFLWELPAGGLHPPDEPPAACAARELREEAGLRADRLRPLGAIFTTPGFTNERIFLFLAEGLHDVGTAHDADEVITDVRRVPLADALGMVRAGEIVDGKTVAGLFLAAQARGATA